MKNIEDRFIELASDINKMRKHMELSDYAENLFKQLSRSASSAKLNYGEALGAESRKTLLIKLGSS